MFAFCLRHNEKQDERQNEQREKRKEKITKFENSEPAASHCVQPNVFAIRFYWSILWIYGCSITNRCRSSRIHMNWILNVKCTVNAERCDERGRNAIDGYWFLARLCIDTMAKARDFFSVDLTPLCVVPHFRCSFAEKARKSFIIHIAEQSLNGKAKANFEPD